MESLFDSTLQSGCRYDPDEVHDVILIIDLNFDYFCSHIIDMPLFTEVY